MASDNTALIAELEAAEKGSREIEPSVIFRTGPLTVRDYQEAIESLTDALQQRMELDAGHGARGCAVCTDSDHVADGCHHNPLVAARRWAAATCVYVCYHCGFVATTDEEAREHFGTCEEEIARCLHAQTQEADNER